MTKFDWLASFRTGKTNLADAIAFYLEESGAPGDLRIAYVSAIARYQLAAYSDFAEPFGIKMSKSEKNKMNRLGLVSEVKTVVDDIYAEGWPLENPDTYPEGTAFHKAAELLGMSVHTVFSIYYRE